MAELHAGTSHSKATAHLTITPYNPMHLYIYSMHCNYISSGSIKAEPQHAIQQTNIFIYLYIETWWQGWTCSSHGRIKPVREKEKRNSQPIHWVFISESLPRRRVGTDMNRIFMHTSRLKRRVKDQAEDCGHPGFGPFVISGSMFSILDVGQS